MHLLEHLTRTPSRRTILQSGMAGAFVLGFNLPARAVNEPEQPPDNTQGKFAPNAFIRIDGSGQTTLVMPQVEMGQGVYTAIPMILADELDADFSKVVLQHAPPNEKLYANPTFGVQVTGNSNSIRAFWKPLRMAGAAARLMLVQAAAQQCQVDPASCSTSNGVVTHAASGRTLAYADLVDAASALPVPQDPPLKDPKDFTLIGKPLKRLDTPNKTDGKVVYGIDAMLPGMKFATLRRCPVFGGKVGRVDDSAARKVPGVQQIVVLDDLVAVVGDHMSRICARNAHMNSASPMARIGTDTPTSIHISSACSTLLLHSALSGRSGSRSVWLERSSWALSPPGSHGCFPAGCCHSRCGLRSGLASRCL